MRVKKIVTLLIVICLVVMNANVVQASEYGSVSESDATYTVTIAHESMIDQQVALLFYDKEGNSDTLDPLYVGYIDQEVADSEGEVIFDEIYISKAGTYNVYIGSSALEQKELIDTVVVTKKNLGDLNGDSKFTSIDALLLLKHMDTVTTDIADVNEDGNIDVKDVLTILQYASGEK